ncbi:thiamine pyrophosphate enzyme, N-terminal TPP binding domain-containing protein [Hyaloraphidium curvatum]|nr:thiamine pyrophosphate enzyme, N-terminal TPP binding domain-containing protein [Hyaloraphidium curvatum]
MSTPTFVPPRHGGDVAARVLASHGVKYVFTLSGGHIAPILVGAESLGMRVVDVRDEATTVFAADAMARLSGTTVAVACVTAGPGLTNVITPLKNAQLAESPVVVISGAAATLLKGQGALQDIDHLAVVKSLTKFSATITRAADIVPVFKKAFYEAKSGVPGPVFIECPLDVLYSEDLIKGLIGGNASQAGSRIAQIYLHFYVSRLFAGDPWGPKDLAPIPIPSTKPTESQIRSAAKIFAAAKNPVLLIGSQALTKGASIADSVRRAAERLGVATFLAGMARGLLGRNGGGGIQLRHVRKKALQGADVVLMLGIAPDFRLEYGRSLSRKSKVIAVNLSAKTLSWNAGMFGFWNPELAIQADAGEFLIGLVDHLAEGGYRPDGAYLAKLREEDQAKETANMKKAQDRPAEGVNPLAALVALNNALPDDSIIVADGGDFVGTAAYVLQPRGPLSWLDPGAFGTLGVGGGFALAAKLWRPDAQVWIVWGDGSSGYSLAEYDTFRRHNLPVASIIGNDGKWMQILREQQPMLGSAVACELDQGTRYDVVAQGWGAKGFLCSTIGETEDAIREAQAELARPGSGGACLNVLIAKSDFREGSISV